MTLLKPAALVVDPLSSACLRVLCALRYKGVDLPLQTVRLREGEHQQAGHRALNPAQAVPVLVLEQGETIVQSVAILEYLEVCFPHPALLPADPLQAARVRGLCNLVAADIHPLTNMRVRSWIARGQGEATSLAWVQHWSQTGQEVLESFLTLWGGRHAVGNTLSMADFFVVPAVFSMLRLGCAPDEDSRLAAVYREALLLPAFERLRTA